MLHKLNILVLLVFLFIPMSALKADTNTLLSMTMINPVDGSIIESFSGTVGGHAKQSISIRFQSRHWNKKKNQKHQYIKFMKHKNP